MLSKKILVAVFFLCTALWGNAQRQVVQLNEDWRFRFSHQVEYNTSVKVSLPHTWNAADAQEGNLNYKRGLGNYERKLFIDEAWKGKRLFLRFEGANSVATVFVNGKYCGEHKGGYSAFVFEITDRVNYGKENKLLVRVSNGERLDVMPLVGDFNMYGGLYRGVSLMVTSETCITPLDFASPGIYLRQKQVNTGLAEVEALVKLSNKSSQKNVEVKAEVKIGSRVITAANSSLVLPAGENGQVVLPLRIVKPHLWNGRQDPFLYQVDVSLWHDGALLDRVEQPLGLRYYSVDPDKGFFLNGKHLTLQGVCRHQDRPGLGNALNIKHHEEDMAIMHEMGVNAMRLAHYQQAEEMYDLTDRFGIITWAEIPFVGPGGYQDKGFVDSPEFRANGRSQLTELIRQNYNHPSICAWGLFNELKERGDNPVEYIKELKALAHEEDEGRLTTAASNQSGNLNYITDLIAWNRYDGWYGSTPASLGKFLDGMHQNHPELCIGISEYGAGGSVLHQTEELKQPKPKSDWHPENWQTYFHIENWKLIHSRPFVWGSFVWNMFDFGAAHRREGDRIGINDKGLVSFDRKTRKDAFYFYKANWNPEKMIHIAGKRLQKTDSLTRDLLVFTNCKKIELQINGKKMGVKSPDRYAIVEWKSMPLQQGENTIVVRSLENSSLQDTYHLQRN